MAITTDDFNKIWASTSPLTPYSFSESQYKEGWNFIGSTPPSRQMWDFLQKNNDEKMQYLLNNFDNYLPLSGGTLTGVVNGVTPTAGDNSTKIATTEFVQESVETRISKSGLPVGFETFTTNPNLQAGWLPLLGGEYSRTTYADLWAWVQTQSGYLLEESAWQAKAAANGGNVPFYSKGNGSTTFRVPALKCWVRGANSISEVGGYLAAGLPNITGRISTGGEYGFDGILNTDNRGAFNKSTASQTGWSAVTTEHSVASKSYQALFDASLSNPIYGNSNTVQPESIVGMWVVKAYGTVTNVGSTDVANISTGLTQAETRISSLETNASITGVVQAFAGRTTPQGWLLCDGSAVSRTDYAALYAVIGTTYGAGDGSTTFNLPNLVDKFVEGSATAGTVKSAGLPNITGNVMLLGDPNSAFGGFQTGKQTGAFYDVKSKQGAFTTYSATTSSVGAAFDASHSSSIYGNSTTVQPPALTMRYIIKY